MNPTSLIRGVLSLVLLVGAGACRSGSAEPAGNGDERASNKPAEALPRPEPIADVAVAPEPAVIATPPAPTSIEHLSPNGVAETCQLLATFPFEPPDLADDRKTMRWYRKDDFKDIAELCAMDLYLAEPSQELTSVGVCPKLHWSTPALELFALEGKLTKKDFQSKRCSRFRKRGAPKLAKLKVPVYAKESESALMYFHFSRLLGNAGLVYPATWRTVDRKELVRWSRMAMGYLAAILPRPPPAADPAALPAIEPAAPGEPTAPATPAVRPATSRNTRAGWSLLLGRHKKASATPDTVGGSLAKNPRGEGPHHAFTMQANSPNYIGSPDHYRKQVYAKMINSETPLAEQLAFDAADPISYHSKLQLLTYGHDYVNLVVMDSVFNQRDRKGNTHSRDYVHFIDDKGRLRWKKKLDDDDHPAVTVELERLILKDNDDALQWNHWGKLNAYKLLPDLRHFDATMFQRIQWLAGLMRDPASADQVKAFFVDAVHIREQVYVEVSYRFLKIADDLEAARASGTLQLDLDLEGAIRAAPAISADAAKKLAKKRKSVPTGKPSPVAKP